MNTGNKMGFFDVFFRVLEDFECLVDLKNMNRYKTCLSSEHKSCEYSPCFVGLSGRIRRNFYCILYRM